MFQRSLKGGEIMKKIITAIKALMLKAIDRVLHNDLYCAYHGMDFYFVLWGLDQQHLRAKIKYDENLSDKEIETLENVRDKLYELMGEYGVDFDHVE